MSTMAFISSSNSCWFSPPAMLLFTPPVAVNLITSAPWEICRRTARRQSSAPLQLLVARDRRSSSMSRFTLLAASAWPPVPEIPKPAATIVGPAIRPDAMASRRAVTLWTSEPRSRTVVKPASSVRRALSTPISRLSSTSRLRTSSRARILSSSAKMCTWASARPGRTNWPLRSISRAPSGGATWPSRTASMRPPRTMIVEGPRGAWPGRSRSAPACMTTTGSVAGCASSGATANAETSRLVHRVRCTNLMSVFLGQPS